MKRIDWWTPWMGAREKEMICSVIDKNFPNDGEYTASFEKKIAEFCEVPYAVGVTSGTAAIFLGLVACDVGPDDEVIIPDITFIATANAVKLTGAKPVLVDVDAKSLCIAPEKIREAITPRTKAIIPVHVSGRAANMPAIIEIAKQHKLYIVEDAAEALGSKFSGQMLGSFGDAGCFSFTANKTITAGQGGMVITKSADIYKKLRQLKDQGRFERGTGGADNHPCVGYNFKLTNLQSAMLLAQFETLPERVNRLREHFLLYRKYLPQGSGIQMPGFNIEKGECPQWVDVLVENRDGLYNYLLERGIFTRKFWYPLHTQAPYRDLDEKFPASMKVGYQALWLPTSLTLTDEDIRYVCEAIDQWVEKK